MRLFWGKYTTPAFQAESGITQVPLRKLPEKNI